METRLNLEVEPQPTETTCGPTCLHAIYRYHENLISLNKIIEEIPSFNDGGTLSVFLANHALSRGFKVKIYTYNLIVFDPTWFSLKSSEFINKLKQQSRLKEDPRLVMATKGYTEFLERGGKLLLEDLKPTLIRRYLKKGLPILTGLSSTYLYRSMREFGPEDDDDDLRGTPQGHFVVLSGYDSVTRRVLVGDPLQPNPAFESGIYSLPIERVITAILLGIVTWDSSFVIIEKND